jgi:hypothetical protein
MIWLLKVLLVSVLLGLSVFLAAAIPWLPARLGFLASGAFLCLWSMRDPALTYRRAFHFLIVIPALPLGFSASADWFGAESLPGGAFNVIVDSGQMLPPLLWFGLASLCLIGDAALQFWGRARRKQLYDVEEAEAKLFEDHWLVQIDFALRPARAVTISGARVQLTGIGKWSDAVETQVESDRSWKQAGRNAPQTVPAGTRAGISVKLSLDKAQLERLLKRRKGLRRLFPVRGAVSLRTEAGIEPLPFTIP